MDHFIVFGLGFALGAVLGRIRYAMASQEKPQQEEEGGPPLYGHNLLEWRKGDKVHDLEVVAGPLDYKKKKGQMADVRAIGWFNSSDGTVGLHGTASGLEGEWLLRITDKTCNLSLEARKAQAEIEKAKKEAEATMIKAEEYQRLQQEQA